MKEFNIIYKLTAINSELEVEEICSIINIGETKPNETLFCFWISSEEGLELLKNKITLLFHEDYFSIGASPVILFETKHLANQFTLLIKNLKLGSLKLTIAFANSEEIVYIEKKNDFTSLLVSGANKEKYFLTKELDYFYNWKEELSTSDKKIITQLYVSQISNQKKSEEIEQLQQELDLKNDSLKSVKTEYKKELTWYKEEIKKIKNWYKKEYSKTPAVVAKFFKKIR